MQPLRQDEKLDAFSGRAEIYGTKHKTREVAAEPAEQHIHGLDEIENFKHAQEDQGNRGDAEELRNEVNDYDVELLDGGYDDGDVHEKDENADSVEPQFIPEDVASQSDGNGNLQRVICFPDANTRRVIILGEA